jgi:hypothetical protein
LADFAIAERTLTKAPGKAPFLELARLLQRPWHLPPDGPAATAGDQK